MNSLLVVLMAVGQAAPAAGTGESTSKAARLRALVNGSVDAYQVFTGDDAEAPMKSVVALQWSNLTRGEGIVPGLTVLWTHGGRPEVVASIFPWNGFLVHEFDSLSRGRVLARRNGVDVWRTRGPGVTFRPLSEAPLPAKSRPGRLRQMKLLAKRFGATMLGWKTDDSDKETLRMLPRPVFRYHVNKQAPASDGVVFSFVMGNDPEVLLILESTATTTASPWQYAFVRQSSAALEGRYREELVWEAEKFPEHNDPSQIHFSARLPLEIESTARGAEIRE